MFLKNRNISSKIKRSKVTDYAALTFTRNKTMQSVKAYIHWSHAHSLEVNEGLDQTCNLESYRYVFFFSCACISGERLTELVMREPRGKGWCTGGSRAPAGKITNGPVHEVSNSVVCAISKASDQIRAFASRLSIL